MDCVDEMKDPSEPRRYEEMTEGERIEASDKAAVFEWWEQQTKGVSHELKKKKIEAFKKGLDELFERLNVNISDPLNCLYIIEEKVND